MSSKLFGNKNEKKPLSVNGAKQTPVKSIPKQTKVVKTGKKK